MNLRTQAQWEAELVGVWGLLDAERGHTKNLAWSLLHAEAERDDALWMLENIRNVIAYLIESDPAINDVTGDALRDIADGVKDYLTPRALDGGRDE